MKQTLITSTTTCEKRASDARVQMGDRLVRVRIYPLTTAPTCLLRNSLGKGPKGGLGRQLCSGSRATVSVKETGAVTRVESGLAPKSVPRSENEIEGFWRWAR